MISVTIAIALLVALITAVALGLLWKHPTPLDGLLCKLPPLRWPRRHTSPGTAAAAPVAVPADFAVPAGRHHARADRITIGGELPDGRWVHGGTGPMPALAWDAATPFAPAPRPGAAERLVRP